MTAATPRPGPGIARYRPASPQESSSTATQVRRLRSWSTLLSFASFCAPGPMPELRESCHIMLMKSHGFSCSRSSYSRAMGRMACSASMWSCSYVAAMSGESSKSIMMRLLGRPPSGDRQSFQRRESARVAQEQLDQMVADVPVSAEHLERVVGDLERPVRGVALGEIGFACRVL